MRRSAGTDGDSRPVSDAMSTVARLLAWRPDKDKRAAGNTAAGTDSAGPSRPVSAVADITDIFLLPPVEGVRKKSDRDPDTKVRTILGQLVASNITLFREAHVEYALTAVEPVGDCHAAFDLLSAVADSVAGRVRPIKQSVTMLGAENREFVTCYLDSLLFAMFGQMDCFDMMLRAEFADRPQARLVRMLRLWVNVLRAGHLVTKNITRQLQNALAGCGWTAASMLAQQDVSEAFAFITEQMGLPLLTLKVDLFHTGKESIDDDHKLVNERLLDVAIPPAPDDGSSVSLESCLEAYFNSKVEIKRILQRRNTLHSVRSTDTGKDFEAGPSDLDRLGRMDDEQAAASSSSPLASFRALCSRTINPQSVFRPRDVPFEARTRDDLDLPARQGHGRGKREVLMPAWQFFQLLPWFPNQQPKTDAQVAAHLSLDRPVLGICLKRYFVSSRGDPGRLETKIDIPLEFSLPHFISDGSPVSGSTDERPGSSTSTITAGAGTARSDDQLFTRFKLALEAIICHRGKSIDAGHYIALVRPRVPYRPGVQGEEQKWFVFDDLNPHKRVQVADIHAALEHELPYLLFYRVVPLDDGGAERPPSYGEAMAGPARMTGLPTINTDGLADGIEQLTIGSSTLSPSPTAADAAAALIGVPDLSITDTWAPSYSACRSGPDGRSGAATEGQASSANSTAGAAEAGIPADPSGSTEPTTSGKQVSPVSAESDTNRSSGFFGRRYGIRKRAKEERGREKDERDDKEPERRREKEKDAEREADRQAGSRDRSKSGLFGRAGLPLSSSRSSNQLSSMPRFFARLPRRSFEKTAEAMKRHSSGSSGNSAAGQSRRPSGDANAATMPTPPAGVTGGSVGAADEGSSSGRLGHRPSASQGSNTRTESSAPNSDSELSAPADDDGSGGGAADPSTTALPQPGATGAGPDGLSWSARYRSKMLSREKGLGRTRSRAQRPGRSGSQGSSNGPEKPPERECRVM